MMMAMPHRYAYLGPAGTFSETAVNTLEHVHPSGAVPFPTIQATLDAVRAGAAERGVVPIENSVEGAVTATLDELAVGEELVICAEVLLGVAFALLGRPPGSPAAMPAVAYGEPARCRMASRPVQRGGCPPGRGRAAGCRAGRVVHSRGVRPRRARRRYS